MHKKRYGVPRITRKLNGMGISCSLYVAPLMRELDHIAHNGKNFKYRPAGSSVSNVSDNLLKRQFYTKNQNRNGLQISPILMLLESGST